MRKLDTRCEIDPAGGRPRSTGGGNVRRVDRDPQAPSMHRGRQAQGDERSAVPRSQHDGSTTAPATGRRHVSDRSPLKPVIASDASQRRSIDRV